MIVQAKGQPAVIVPTTTQTPKAIIPAEIRNESTISMIGPLSSERKQSMAWNLSIYLDRHVARDSFRRRSRYPRVPFALGVLAAIALGAAAIAAWMIWQRSSVSPSARSSR